MKDVFINLKPPSYDCLYNHKLVALLAISVMLSNRGLGKDNALNKIGDLISDIKSPSVLQFVVETIKRSIERGDSVEDILKYAEQSKDSIVDTDLVKVLAETCKDPACNNIKEYHGVVMGGYNHENHNVIEDIDKSSMYDVKMITHELTPSSYEKFKDIVEKRIENKNGTTGE